MQAVIDELEREPPARKGSDAEVIEFVRATPGAVGYVSRPWPGFKVLEKF